MDQDRTVSDRPRNDVEVTVEAVSVGVEKAGNMLGVSRTAVFELMREGRLSSFKIGRRRLIKVEAIKRLVDAA